MRRLRAAAILALVGLLLAPAAAFAKSDFQPQEEFKLDPYVSIHIGGLDLSINKAVVYLMISTVLSIGFGIFVVRGGLRMRPTKAQNAVELIYDFVDEQIARQTLPASVFSRWFPYVATLFIFIGINNLISFIPLPVGHESSLGGLPDFALYAATANINVTLALTLCTFIIYNYEGVRAHGVIGYLKTLAPEGLNPVMRTLVFALELLSNILRLVSLSVRLFANMLAGHLLIIVSAGFVILIGNFAGIIAIPIGVFFYFFEWVLIAGLQAFIFAMLSGIYIGFAVEAPH